MKGLAFCPPAQGFMRRPLVAPPQQRDTRLARDRVAGAVIDPAQESGVPIRVPVDDVGYGSAAKI